MNEKLNLLAEDCGRDGDELYFVSIDGNIIFNLNLDTGKINIVDCIPEESLVGKRLCSKILLWKNKIIFVPMNAKKLWIFDKKTKNWTGISLGKYTKKKNKIFQAIICKNDLFMIGCSLPAIFQFDLITEQLSIIEYPLNHLIEKKIKDSDIFFRRDFVQKETEIYMASCLNNSVMKFDLQNKKVKFYRVGNEKNQYSGIAWDGKSYWLAPRYMTNIVKWDGKDGVVEYELPYMELESEIGFSGIIPTSYGMLLYGRKKFSIMIIQNDYNINMQVVPNTYIFVKKEGKYIFSLDIHGELTIESDKSKQIYNIREGKNNIRKFWLKKIYNNDIRFPDKGQESVFFNLTDYIDLLSYTENKKNLSELKDQIGSSVWKGVKRSIEILENK